MKRELSHDEAIVALEAAAVDALDADEREAVLAHVAGCAECRATLRQLRATAAHLPFSVASGADSKSRDRVRSRLMARAAADSGHASGAGAVVSPVHTPTANSRQFRASQPVTMDYVPADRASGAQRAALLGWRRAEWIAMAASILLIASVGLLAAAVKDRSDMRDAFKAQLSAGQTVNTETDSLRSVIASRDSLIAGITGRDVEVMSLTASGANAAFARMFWDQQRNTWTLIAHNMPALRPGRTYQLWLVTASKKISAGTFQSRNGEAVVRATYALAPSDLKTLAVTEEPTGGVPQPTGAPVIAVAAH